MDKEIKIELADGVLVTIKTSQSTGATPAPAPVVLNANPLGAPAEASTGADRIGFAAKVAGIASATMALIRLFLGL